MDPRGGPREGQVAGNLRDVEGRLISHAISKEAKSQIAAEDMAMLEAQLIGWVLIALFFGAMIGGHRRTTDR